VANSFTGRNWPEQVGEMCFREIDGTTVLSYLNASTGSMEVRVADDPTPLGDAPVTTVVQHDEWPDPAESLPRRGRGRCTGRNRHVR
jgi:hypothetical protein